MERGGYAFEAYRQDGATGMHIGRLSQSAPVGNYDCAANEWIHFNEDWSLAGCTLAEPEALDAFEIPAGTWVMPRSDRLIVALPRDTPCNGYVCGGSGGPKGTQTVFFQDGALKSFFPPTDTSVGEVICKASLLAPIELNRDGSLARCVAARDARIGDVAIERNDTVMTDAEGRLRVLD
ncbi:MAG: hypothetical protein AAFO88_00050 [Pseudomonadota bacterium]